MGVKRFSLLRKVNLIADRAAYHMEIQSIQKLVENYTLPQLQEAEFAIIQEKAVKIKVEGKDQAERLSNVIAACWILEEMKSRDLEFFDALCAYNKKVRDQVGSRAVS